MNLADLANQELGNFDPKKDVINNTNQGLPAGDYVVAVEDISHHVYEKSGYDCVRMVFQVTDGEHAGEKEFYNISFATTTKAGKEMPEFVLTRNMKFIAKLGALLGKPVEPSVFAGANETDIHEDIATLLRDGKGTLITLTVTFTPNKKDPSNPYKNYELAPAEQPEAIDVDENDIPF